VIQTCEVCGRKIVRGSRPLAGRKAVHTLSLSVRILDGTVCRICLREDGYVPIEEALETLGAF
jgi:hypothetical protein